MDRMNSLHNVILHQVNSKVYKLALKSLQSFIFNVRISKLSSCRSSVEDFTKQFNSIICLVCWLIWNKAQTK